ncbi:MAG: transcription elongation factor GreA [Chloroflexi bacterium]|nr:transcription elongation factor GreA [Chloroflexota bacterium]
MKNQLIITKTGKAKLEEELAELKGPRRMEISRRLKSAIEMGDLSENADYITAKEDQGFLEGRIQEIETILSNAEVVDEDNVRSDKVQIGHKVTVREGDEDEEVFELVGISEVNTLLGKISYESPIGSALLDKRPGEKVQVKTPGGVLEFTIVKIE